MARSKTLDTLLTFSSDELFQWKIRSCVCEEDPSHQEVGHTYLECLEAKYFSQDNFGSHGILVPTSQQVCLGASFLGHPLSFLKGELGGPGIGTSQQQEP